MADNSNLSRDIDDLFEQQRLQAAGKKKKKQFDEVVCKLCICVIRTRTLRAG